MSGPPRGSEVADYDPDTQEALLDATLTVQGSAKREVKVEAEVEVRMPESARWDSWVSRVGISVRIAATSVRCQEQKGEDELGGEQRFAPGLGLLRNRVHSTPGFTM